MHKWPFKIKHLKIAGLILVYIISAMFYFEGKTYPPLHELLITLGYFGVFFAGFFYAFGFTAPLATAVLLVLAGSSNIYIAALVAGIGALISDLGIFLFVRRFIIHEVRSMTHEKAIKVIVEEEKLLGHFKKYIVTLIALILIASPLPTELGITLIATLKHISIKKFMVMAYLLHTCGIFIILLIGSAT